MGCTYSVYGVGKKKKLRSNTSRYIDRLSCLRNQIVLVAEDTGGSAITELQQALEEYLPILVGLTKKEHGLEDSVEFKWKNLEDGRQETSVANAWFELLSVVHMMAMLTLSEADTLMILKDYSGSGFRVVSTDCKRDAVDLLLKAAGYLEFCVRNVLCRIPPEIKYLLLKVTEKIQGTNGNGSSIQGTGIQLGLAVESQKATLSVKRRLACELLIYYSQIYNQAYQCLSGSEDMGRNICGFIKWKFVEAKAAAYYYRGLVLDKGSEPTCHTSAVCCTRTTFRKQESLHKLLPCNSCNEDPAWDSKNLEKQCQPLKEHLKGCEDEIETE
ncbi:hypothetical protein GQ457_02G012680 [Hibiscus cannabinus]